MKTPTFKSFVGSTLDQVLAYLRNQHSSNLNDLNLLLRRLSLTDNFESFRVTVTIAAGAEQAIENKIRGGIPTDRLIVRSDSADVVDGDTEWSQEYVYLKNTGASPATVTVIFLK